MYIKFAYINIIDLLYINKQLGIMKTQAQEMLKTKYTNKIKQINIKIDMLTSNLTTTFGIDTPEVVESKIGIEKIIEDLKAEKAQIEDILTYC